MKSQAVVSVDPKNARVVGEHAYDRPRRACRFDRSGRFLFSGGDDNLVRRWDLKNNEHETYEGHESWVLSFAFPSDGGTVISGGYDGRLLWWDLEGPASKPQAAVDAHKGWIRSMTLSPDGKWLATCGNDHLVKVWSTATRELVQELAGHTCHVYSVAFHPGGMSLVSADHLGIIREWVVTSGKERRQLDASPLYTWHKGYRAAAGGVRGLGFSPDGRWLAGCGLTEATDTFGQVVHPAVVVLDWASGKQARVQRSRGNEKGVAWGVTFHQSGAFHAAVSGGRDAKHLYFLKPDADKPFHTMSLPSAGRDLAMHPDGSRIAIAHFDNRIRVVNLAKAKP